VTARPVPERGPHPLSWFVGCVLVGWVVVYNIMRLAGSAPSGAAWISLVVGGLLGAAVFAAGLLGVRHLNRSGRVVRHGAADIPPPAEMTDAQRTLLGRAWPALAALAVVAAVMGVALVADWFGEAPGDRPTTLLVLAAWNIRRAVGGRRGHAPATVRGRRHRVGGPGRRLTAVLAGWASRAATSSRARCAHRRRWCGGAAAALAVWRLRARCRSPWVRPSWPSWPPCR